jgi:hypothetical protein
MRVGGGVLSALLLMLEDQRPLVRGNNAKHIKLNTYKPHET